MLSKEILKKIAEIEIHTRRIMSSTLMGDSRSAQKGSGFEFNQIREYQMGDDVRFIDWRASARSNKMLVKEYVEERNRTIMILLDVSRSTVFTSNNATNLDVMKQVAAVLAFVAGYSKDRVGLVLYTDVLECVIPPAMGHTHVHELIKKVFSHEPSSLLTDGSIALQSLKHAKNRNAVVFVISDCIDEKMNVALKKAARVHEIVVIRCLDSLEQHLKAVGFLSVRNPETGDTCTLNTKEGSGVAAYLDERYLEQRKLYSKYGIDCLDIANNESFIDEVVRFFRRRMTY